MREQRESHSTLLDDGPGERRPIIRGIEGAGEATVGIYYDEFPITSTPGATNDAGRFTPDIKLVDVQQVAVLRGPQGTLFGAGSEGGTLQTLFNKPDLRDFSGTVSADVGEVSHGTQNVETSGVFNLALVDGVLGVRLVGYHINRRSVQRELESAVCTGSDLSGSLSCAALDEDEPETTCFVTRSGVVLERDTYIFVFFFPVDSFGFSFRPYGKLPKGFSNPS